MMDLTKLHLHWRASHYKNRSYRSYSLARAYRKDGKNRKEIVLKLGRLSDEEADRWRKLLRAIKKPNTFLTSAEDIIVTDRFAYLDVAAVSAIWDEWRLDRVFGNDGKRKLAVATIARILAVNRCIDPAAKSQTPQWLRSTALHWLLDVDPEAFNPSRIFRELDVIETHKESICAHLFKLMSRLDPESMKSVFYDLSSTTFYGSRCVLMKWGHCKEGFRNHVVLAIVVNKEGLPFYWEVLPGGTADSKTVIWLLGRLKERFKVNNTTLVFDRGMVSDDNLSLLEKEGIKYISAMDRNQLEGLTSLDFTELSYLDPERVDEQADDLPGFTKLDSGTYYRETKVDGKRRYILCFNPQLFKDQRRARRQAVADFRAFVKNLNAELREVKNSRQQGPTYEKYRRQLVKTKLSGFVDVKLRAIHVKRGNEDGSERKVCTYVGTIGVDKTLMRRVGRLDGFWLLVTNHNDKEGETFTVSAEETITPYRDKVVIESAFRDIKSFVEVAPVHVWTEEHVKAHYSICVLSHLINRTITLRLHKHPGEKTRDIVAHEKFYEKLSACQIDHIEIENVQLSTYKMTRLTHEQKELVNRVGIEDLLSRDITKKIVPS